MSPTFNIFLIPRNTGTSQSSATFQPETLSTATFLSKHTPHLVLGQIIRRKRLQSVMMMDNRMKKRGPALHATPPVPTEVTAHSIAISEDVKLFPKPFPGKKSQGVPHLLHSPIDPAPSSNSLCGRNSVISVMFTELKASLL